MRVVIHGGLPKTGTTALQHACALHRDALAAAGICYPPGRPASQHHAMLESRSPVWDPAPLLAVVAAAEASGAETLLLSGEVVSLCTAAEIARLRACLCAREVTWILTVRHWYGALRSRWISVVGSGEPRPFDRFAEAVLTEALEAPVTLGRDVLLPAGRFGEAIDQVRAGAPADALRLVSYDHAARGAGGAVAGVLTAAGVPTDLAVALGRAAGRPNSAGPEDAYELIRLLNGAVLARAGSDPDRPHPRELLHLGRSLHRVPPEVRADLEAFVAAHPAQVEHPHELIAEHERRFLARHAGAFVAPGAFPADLDRRPVASCELGWRAVDAGAPGLLDVAVAALTGRSSTPRAGARRPSAPAPLIITGPPSAPLAAAGRLLARAGVRLDGDMAAISQGVVRDTGLRYASLFTSAAWLEDRLSHPAWGRHAAVARNRLAAATGPGPWGWVDPDAAPLAAFWEPESTPAWLWVYGGRDEDPAWSFTAELILAALREHPERGALVHASALLADPGAVVREAERVLRGAGAPARLGPPLGPAFDGTLLAALDEHAPRGERAATGTEQHLPAVDAVAADRGDAVEAAAPLRAPRAAAARGAAPHPPALDAVAADRWDALDAAAAVPALKAPRAAPALTTASGRGAFALDVVRVGAAEPPGPGLRELRRLLLVEPSSPWHGAAWTLGLERARGAAVLLVSGGADIAPRALAAALGELAEQPLSRGPQLAAVALGRDGPPGVERRRVVELLAEPEALGALLLRTAPLRATGGADPALPAVGLDLWALLVGLAAAREPVARIGHACHGGPALPGPAEQAAVRALVLARHGASLAPVVFDALAAELAQTAGLGAERAHAMAVLEEAWRERDAARVALAAAQAHADGLTAERAHADAVLRDAWHERDVARAELVALRKPG